MKKLLYITASTKPEEMSTSKAVGREFVDRFMEQYSDYELMELDIYNEYIPEMNYKYFKCRAELVSGQEYEALSQDDKLAVDRINELCDQFLSADVYVIAAPMWSVMFPAKLKTYIDCIILNNKVISVTPDKVKGLLDDKERKMMYIQSSGGVYPKIFSGKINHGVNYIHDTFKFLGISKFDKIMVEGVDMPSIGREAAIEKAVEEMDDIISNMQ
ncbi:FMN-dependent NADH-azoreductase [Clostridium carboxidivorans P7]|uniref:FMN dependent NADH:quinone oxidoreductase n=1 Tax=Clostridium carboxidivorans P7 TaxID=536227 RepID=C6Q1S0_9CLOT|nr:NAD(P)H-dependent oxidoreductase [Clostridium carboxidivorans]AKN29306.1 FMN-dependent NADH-azoreductase [Clostridium carboxidivorans P7]EET84563.1 NAD(P)H dehydrogenase (quinone) [Clostridium carboxidivorans P7]EFG89786.1 flavodoxin-like fold protein [Clostridium carboxidivorans P7]